MIWSLIRNSLIKWWYVIYIPIAKKIWPTKEEKKMYEEEHPEEFEEPIPEPTLKSNISTSPMDYGQSAMNSQPFSQDYIDPSLLGNKNYNATTHSMSGDYGKGPLDDDAKAQLDAILKSNYNATDSLSIENAYFADATTDADAEPESNSTISQEEPVPCGSDLTQEENDEAMEQLRQAEEIYERLRREAEEDEARKQAEIEAAKNLS